MQQGIRGSGLGSTIHRDSLVVQRVGRAHPATQHSREGERNGAVGGRQSETLPPHAIIPCAFSLPSRQRRHDEVRRLRPAPQSLALSAVWGVSLWSKAVGARWTAGQWTRDRALQEDGPQFGGEGGVVAGGRLREEALRVESCGRALLRVRREARVQLR